MKKIKFLILALLGLILIPTTNAYELGNQNFWSDSWAPSPTTRHKGMCLHYSRDWYMTFDGKTSFYSSISSNNTSCPEWAILGNFFSPKDYSSPWNEWIYNNYFSYVNSKKNGEWMDMIRTVYQNWEHKSIIYTLPSRTAYKRTSKSWISYMFTQIYFYHNQFILYDPVKEFWLSFLGKMNIVWWAVFSNPSLTDDNLWFVDYIHKKAYSATITNTAAWKRLLWTDVSKERLQAVNWTKSYTINSWGFSFLPPRFKINKQGGSGYQYIEDIEFTSPEWWQGNSSNQNNVAENYNKCVNYYSDVKNLAYYSQKCGEDPADEETLNRVKVDSWNAETESQTVIDQLTWANRNKCGRFAKAKKKYKEKYKDQWGKFYADFGIYARTPESVNVEVQCKGVELEHNSPNNPGIQALKDFFKSPLDYLQSFRDRFNNYDWQPIWVYSWKNYYNLDFQADSSKLRQLYNECFSSGWIYSIITEEDRMNSCRKYEQLKLELWKVYFSMTGVDFSSWFQEYVNSLEKNNLNDDIGLGNRFISVISDPFYSGFNSVNLVSAVCSWPKYEFFNVFFYLFYFWAVLYIFKLFS